MLTYPKTTGKMELNEQRWQTSEMRNSLQWAMRAKLHSDFLQAEQRELWMAVGYQHAKLYSDFLQAEQREL